MTSTTQFGGTPAESNDLVNAIAHNCDCSFGLMGVRQSTCPPHEGLVHDQRWLDGLVWERRLWQLRSPDAGLRRIKLGE